MPRSTLLRTALMPLLAIVSTLGATFLGRALDLNTNSMGFVFLIVVLAASLRGGLVAGMLASIISTLCYNYFFFPPLYTFVIHDASNWVALAAFLATSVVVSRLVLVARSQANRAALRAEEVESLYREREQLLREQAHVDALRESETLKTALLRAVSHDLSTPLTAITLHAQALRRKGEQYSELRKPITGIADEAARLNRRVANLLSMARLEAGKATPHPEPTPVADLFYAVKENLPSVFESRPVRLFVDPQCPDANVDPSLALEVLVNLVENAHRVSSAEAELELLAGVHPSDPHRVRIELRDRGPGLPDGVTDAAGNILPGATTDMAHRGLGLEIARGLAAANGGNVSIVGRDGGGSAARFDVPAASSREESNE